jgi:transaldolase
MDRLSALQEAGVSIWLDTLSRDLLDTGEFARLVDRRHVTGATSNPTIFAKAITGSDSYLPQLRRLLAAGMPGTREVFFALALEDVRRAADILMPVYQRTDGTDGFVSFECTPDLADHTDATIDQARDLWARLQRPNTMIKVPATASGVPAIEQLTAEGININVTLLFSIDRYQQVIDAYQTGLEARVATGQPIRHITSVASFFVSRVDNKVDAQLPRESPLRGRAAIANAGVAFATYRRAIASERWKQLAAAGARPQRPLWASTGTKNNAYSDVLYVESLIAPGVINTMPQATLDAFADHGTASGTLTETDDAAVRVLDQLRDADIDLTQITDHLEREGVNSFCDSYARLLTSIQDRADHVFRPSANGPNARHLKPASEPPDTPVSDEQVPARNMSSLTSGADRGSMET